MSDSPKIYKTGPKPSVHESRASIRRDTLLVDQPPLNIVELVHISNEYAVRNGFWEHAVLRHAGVELLNPSIVPEKIALTHAELSEALEAFRAKEPTLWFTEKGKPEGVASELADAVIRICDLAKHLGVDLEEAIAIKGAFNNTRP